MSPLLRAAALAIDGWKKQAAYALYPELDHAPSKLSRILTGELGGKVWELLEVALQGPNPRPLLDAIGELAGVEWRELRQEPHEIREAALLRLDQVGDVLAEIRAGLAKADDVEHRRMVKAGQGARATDHKPAAAG